MAAFYDELVGADGEARPHARTLVAALEALGPEALTQAGRRRDAIFMQQGITFDAGGPGSGAKLSKIDASGTLDPRAPEHLAIPDEPHHRAVRCGPGRPAGSSRSAPAAGCCHAPRFNAVAARAA